MTSQKIGMPGCTLFVVPFLALQVDPQKTSMQDDLALAGIFPGLDAYLKQKPAGGAPKVFSVVTPAIRPY